MAVSTVEDALDLLEHWQWGAEEYGLEIDEKAILLQLVSSENGYNQVMDEAYDLQTDMEADGFTYDGYKDLQQALVIILDVGDYLDIPHEMVGTISYLFDWYHHLTDLDYDYKKSTNVSDFLRGLPNHSEVQQFAQAYDYIEQIPDDIQNIIYKSPVL